MACRVRMNFADEQLLKRYYDRMGRPITPMTWVRHRASDTYCRIAFDECVSDSATVINAVVTSWAGVNLAPFAHGTGAPFIFETRIFGGQHDLADTFYATEADARAGHVAVVADLQSGRLPWWMAEKEETG